LHGAYKTAEKLPLRDAPVAFKYKRRVSLHGTPKRHVREENPKVHGKNKTYSKNK